MMQSKVFLVDFSADHSVRMTVAEPGRLPPVAHLDYCYSLDDLGAAFDACLEREGRPELMGAAFSVCGWEREGAFDMPDHSYSIHRDWARQHLQVNRLHIVNDCVAVALSLDQLQGDECVLIRSGCPDPDAPRALVAIGRSLGTTCVVSDEFGKAMALPCAGGHSDLPVANRREFDVFELLARKYGRVSRVRAVCTPGLEAVYAALAVLEDHTADPIKAPQIVTQALSGDPLSLEAVEMVTGWLAAMVSDVALINGARGGVYVGGSFFDVLGPVFDRDTFARRFGDKGRLSRYLSDVPVYQIRAAETEMIGLSSLFS